MYTSEKLEQTTQLLGLNPEFYTIWNYRRSILQFLFDTNELDRKKTLEDDLKLVMALLKRFPKCYWIWNHRVWCLYQLQNSNEANWQFELQIVSKLLEMDSRNFHGWQYRRFIVLNIERGAGGDAELLKINLEEFDNTTAKIKKNISNFSAWHNRSQLIPKIFSLLQLVNNQEHEVFKSPYTLLVHEIELIKTGMYMDVDDSSVWLYLFWLLSDKLFVDYSTKEPESYSEILSRVLKDVNELNELEKDEHEHGWDNVWCLKARLFITNLLAKTSGTKYPESKQWLEKLIEYDPLRKGRYIDQIQSL